MSRWRIRFAIEGFLVMGDGMKFLPFWVRFASLGLCGRW